MVLFPSYFRVKVLCTLSLIESKQNYFLQSIARKKERDYANRSSVKVIVQMSK